MIKTKRTNTLETLLNIGLKEKQCRFDMLLLEGDPHKIVSLIKKQENLAATLKAAGDDGLEEILSAIAKLKTILSKIYKKNRHKLINDHWEKMKKENDIFIRVTSKRLAGFKKRLTSKNLF